MSIAQVIEKSLSEYNASHKGIASASNYYEKIKRNVDAQNALLNRCAIWIDNQEISAEELKVKVKMPNLRPTAVTYTALAAKEDGSGLRHLIMEVGN